MKKSLIILLLLVLAVAGCTTQKTTGGVTGAYANCYGGEQQMVTAAFADYAPVSLEESPYAPGEEIDVEVILNSKYSDDITKAKVRLTGDAAIDTIFSGAKEGNAGTLYAIDSETCLQEPTEVEVGPIIYKGDITTKVSKEITGLYCYEQPVIVKAYLYFTEDITEIGTNLPAGANPASSVQVTQIDQNPVDVDSGETTGEMRFKIYLANLGAGTIVPSLNDCFEYRDTSYREEFKLNVDGAYNIDCPEDVKLSRGEKTDFVACLVTGIDSTNLGSQPSEITITLSDFAYEEEIPPTTIWLEP
jgi:hypothetical protein